MLTGGIYRTPQVFPYDRERAVQYAHAWAYKRNPAYLDFHNLGGDCTNFASQCIYAGSNTMNYTPVHGWYYASSSNRTPSWTGVNFLHKFLVNNKGVGPFAENVDVGDVRVGDLVQLSFDGGNDFAHSPVVVETGTVPSIDNILVATHTYDRDYYALTNYNWVHIRFIHIVGVRR